MRLQISSHKNKYRKGLQVCTTAIYRSCVVQESCININRSVIYLPTYLNINIIHNKMTCVKVGVFCLLVFVVISSSSYQALAQDRATMDKNAVMKDCLKYIHKNLGDPFPKVNGACCQTITASPDVHAICEKFTAADKDQISLWKWVAVTQRCGNGLPAGAHCAGKLIFIYMRLASYIRVLLNPFNIISPVHLLNTK